MKFSQHGHFVMEGPIKVKYSFTQQIIIRCSTGKTIVYQVKYRENSKSHYVLFCCPSPVVWKQKSHLQLYRTNTNTRAVTDQLLSATFVSIQELQLRKIFSLIVNVGYILLLIKGTWEKSPSKLV